MTKRVKTNCAFFLLLLALVACAPGLPSPKSAHSSTASFFKRYSKKYKQSFVAQNPVTSVAINRVQRQSRHYAQIDAFLNLRQGEVARVLLTIKNSPPFGWTITSWEVLEIR